MNKTKSFYLSLFLLLFVNAAWSDERVTDLKRYIEARYGRSLTLSDPQIEQLTWTMHDRVATPEMDSSAPQSTTTGEGSFVLRLERRYREIPRALSRLYCLQLLREGTEEAYHRFIAPQSELEEGERLSRESFNQMSLEIAALPEADYEVLQASAILDAVTLSPEAREAARPLLGTMPTDSVGFLSATAGADIGPDVYPLVHSVIERNPSAAQQFRVIFLRDSHFRHMMYGEGSLAMFRRLQEGIRRGEINQSLLNLWYYHWMVNIAGFRGHVHPDNPASSTGSYYLARNTWRAMSRLRELLNNMLQNPSDNPMNQYLASRGEWLGLHLLTEPESDEFFALALLGANLRFFSIVEGDQLVSQFRSLPYQVQNRWIRRARQQRSQMSGPAPTFIPALYANAFEMAGPSSISRVLPIVLMTLDEEAVVRDTGGLNGIPVSFREMARNETVDQIVHSPLSVSVMVVIDPENGIAHPFFLEESL